MLKNVGILWNLRTRWVWGFQVAYVCSLLLATVAAKELRALLRVCTLPGWQHWLRTPVKRMESSPILVFLSRSSDPIFPSTILILFSRTSDPTFPSTISGSFLQAGVFAALLFYKLLMFTAEFGWWRTVFQKFLGRQQYIYSETLQNKRPNCFYYYVQVFQKSHDRIC